MIVTVIGGPNKNPSYSNTINWAVEYFPENSLDTFSVTINAPGRSISNWVERRMVDLSIKLSGAILLPDHFVPI